MQCFLCNLDKSETVTLWNGEEYCEECTGRVHKGLYSYAQQQHETLNSNYRQFSNWQTVFNLIKQQAFIGLIVIGIFFAIMIPDILKAENVMEKLFGFIFLFSFLYIVLVFLRSWWQPIFLSRIIKHHPRINIADGKVMLSVWNPYWTKPIELPLSAVKLQILPLKKDFFFSRIAWGNKKRYSLLDFSECVKEACPCMSYFEKRAWRKSPYLCFTASPYENGILAAFFRLIGQTHAWLQDETFPTEEEQLPDTTVIANPRTSGWAIAAMYFGLFSVLIFPAPIALILGIIALRDCQQRSCKGRGRAIFAIVIGALFSFPIAFFFFLLFLDWLVPGA